ncbi:hypothetical protein NMY22_g12868 [Coprinellus aureogranulatus]|nr:hypothetical protein NMY22_g12868 [Coprinellus aureogranulatus]
MHEHPGSGPYKYLTDYPQVMATPRKMDTPRTYTYELVSFKVEDKVYRVPRHGFTAFSDVFNTMFSLPQPKESSEGQSDENPIMLPSCTKLEFESLLEVLYPTAARLQVAPLGKNQWIGVLKLSSLWSMDKVRQLAIDELDKCSSLGFLEKVILAKKYRISGWLIAGYMAVIENWGGPGGKNLTLDVLGNILGWETAARIVELASKRKEPPKPVQSSIKLRVGCFFCNSAVTRTVLVPMRKTAVISCEKCDEATLTLTPAQKGANALSASDSPLLRGEALAKAVAAAFKEELSLCN